MAQWLQQVGTWCEHCCQVDGLPGSRHWVACRRLAAWASSTPHPHAHLTDTRMWLVSLPQVVGVEVQAPFQRLTYAEAMAKYASGELRSMVCALCRRCGATAYRAVLGRG